MLTKITLIVALCSNVSASQVKDTLAKLQAQNPGSKVTVRLDQKAQCDASGKILEKQGSRKSTIAKN